MKKNREVTFYEAETIQELIDLLAEIKSENEGDLPIRKFDIRIKLPDKHLEIYGEQITEEDLPK